MAFNYLDTTSLSVFSPIANDALLFPRMFHEPGSASIHKGHFGQGATVIPFTGSLVAGQSATAPFTWNFLGLGLETGIRNLIGTDVKVGKNISLGGLVFEATSKTTELAAAYGKASVKVNTAVVKETKNEIKTTFNTILGDLNGVWRYNGVELISLISGICSAACSDIILKEDIEPIQTPLSKILKLQGISHNWRKDTAPKLAKQNPGRNLGLIAQEVEKVVPEVVSSKIIVKNNKQEEVLVKGIQYQKLVPLLIEGMKEQQEQIEDLKTRIFELESNK